MAVELATGYVSIVPDTSKVAPGINSALRVAQGQADTAGKAMGSKLSSGLASTFKVGAAATMATAGGVAAAAFTKGFGRLTAIDDAQGKLKALGHDTAGVATIMESALASVKGTSYGLGDAAGIAASAVAAGIEPGKELTRYLGLTADAAAIAGTSLSEMGQIINKVQTSGTAYTMEITQLADRGLPIWQWLAKEMGVAQSEMKDLVSEGKIDSATYLAAIEKNIGGAATAATTVRSAYENMNAALGRVGAAALEPTFNRLTGWLQTATGGFDDVTPAVKAFAEALDDRVFEDFGPKVAEAWREFKQSDFAVDSASKLVTLMEALQSAGVALAPSIQSVAESLAKAGAPAGGAGFTVLLNALNGIVPVVSGVLAPALNTLSDLMGANEGVVTALLTAYAGFKLVSMLSATKSMQGLQTATVGAFSAVRNGAAGVRDTRRMFEQTGHSVGRLGSAVAYLSTGPGSVGKMASSFRNAQSSVSTFGTALGTAAAAGTGLRIAAGGLVSALGGPAGIALAAGTTAAVIFGQQQAKAAEHSRALATAAEAVGRALNESNGAMTTATQEAAATALEQSKLSGSGQSLLQYLEALGVSGQNAAKGIAGSKVSMESTLAVLKEAADLEAQANRERVGSKSSGFESTALGQLLNYNGARDKNNEAQQAFADYKQLQAEAEKQAGALKRAGIAAGNIDMSGTATALGTMRDTMSQFGSATGGAASKIDILNGGLATLRGDQLSIEDAQQRVNDSLRGFTSALSDGGSAAVLASGQIDTGTEAGSRLYSAMKDVQGAFDGAGAAAIQQAKQTTDSTAEISAAALEAGQKIRDDFIAQAVEAGKTRGEAEALADAYRLFPQDLVTNVVLNDKDARAQLEFLTQPGTKEIQVSYTNASGTSTYNGPYNSQLDRAQGGRLPKFAYGGRLPKTGPGTDRTDGIVGVTSDGQAIANVDRGEWIINRHSSEKYNGVLAAINNGTFELPKYATGGIAGALSAARAVDGNKYVLGGTGPDNFDCSGFVGWLQQIAMGIVGSTKRLYTTYSLIGGATEGLVKGLGPAGTLFRVGSSEEHMAATIDGHNVESGGAHGSSGIDGGRAGAADSQFPHKFHLPNDLVAEFASGAYNTTGGRSYGGRRSKSAPQWTDENETDLKSAEVAVTQAEEARAEAEAALAEGKKTQADVDQANLKVDKAHQKVLKLQGKKDDAANGVTDAPAPQAPALEKAYNEQELSRIDAQLAFNDANTRRNEVYDDPDATDDDRLRADAELSRAKLALEEDNRGGTAGFSIKTRLRDYATDLAGIAFDAAMAQMPFELGESRWWDVGAEVAGAATAAIQARQSLGPESSFSPKEIDAQLGYSPEDAKDGLPEWAKAMRKNAPKVYDTGGWLEPGGMAINLSDKPEPIFNSPEQLAKFAGGLQLAPESEGGGTDFSINLENVTVADPKQLELMLRQMQMNQRAKAGAILNRR